VTWRAPLGGDIVGKPVGQARSARDAQMNHNEPLKGPDRQYTKATQIGRSRSSDSRGGEPDLVRCSGLELIWARIGHAQNALYGAE